MPRPPLFIFLVALAGASFAHGDLGPRIFDLGVGIEIDPGNSDLYLRRGNLNLLVENRKAAREDFESALEIDPEISDAELGKAKALLGLGLNEHALRTIDRFRKRYPDLPAGWILHARILRKLDRYEEAARSLSIAIEQIPRPEPDLYLERARTLLSSGPDFADEALEGLDKGLEKLGALVSLEGIEDEVGRDD